MSKKETGIAIVSATPGARGMKEGRELGEPDEEKPNAGQVGAARHLRL